MPLASFNLADDFDEGEQGIRRRAAVHAGVQIGLGAHRFDLGVDQTAQADAQRGKIGREKFGIADQREIGLQLGFLLAHIFGDGLAADFFFPFEKNLHVDGQLAVASLHERFQRLYFHPELAFVVHRAAGVDVVVALGGLEGRSHPLIERIGRLHVVVGVHQHGGLAGGVQPVGIHQRMSFGRDDFDVFDADAAQFVGHEVGRFLHVGFVLVQGADAGDAKKIFQFVRESAADCCGHNSLRGKP